MERRLFGTSGIRGVANREITPSLAVEVGAALATSVSNGFIAVGRDTRLTGEMLEKALAAGIVSCGVDVKLLGIVPTPVLAFMTRDLGAGAGVSISASHNPPEYNGLKVFEPTSMAYTEEKEKEIESLITQHSFKPAPWNQVGLIKCLDTVDRYVESLFGEMNFEKEWRIALDLFNGATCTVAPSVFEKLNFKTIILDGQPDGHFPSGQPEPRADTLRRLGEIVRETGAEIGFGYDGDGDRMVAVDEKGEVPPFDLVLGAYAAHLVRKRGGGVVVTHVEASMCIDDAVKKAGGRVVRTKVGDVAIAETMAERGALFGGEPIGAWIHPQYHLCPDGILSSLLLLKALEEEGKTLREFVGEIPRYSLIRKNIACPEEKKKKAMNEVSEKLVEQFPETEQVLRVDGVRLELGSGWILVRASGTEPLIRITVEAKEKAEEIMYKVEGYLKKLLEAM
jgi:phosphoglucosamine mutase